ncbi:TetR/AcrR family transcriptional regulator [Verrucosispora sp. NA02020]|uniref:TetR/AcrR family transcriptional regulator n=1 Tax=Verrucosispora sp. NA02020 TaxID=2742132 RepID=UPI0015921BAA|nr:TetR/AcrR family transcriptional regulator [Verrucosispora sp. NA02020]QKW11918.1 TetR/AcrR family transcriptional regulator [Verrucosispora sp. NA02020]
MEAGQAEKPVRERAAAKRKAVLAAARELFVRQGVDRVSMDAVAAEAKVSKATVYDYFGDKRRLFLAILADASDSLLASAHHAFDEHLSAEVPITTVARLEEALTALLVDFGTTMVGSADYAAAFALAAQERLRTPTASDDVSTDMAEELMAEYVAGFAEAGLLETDDPRLATEHLFALTVLLAYNQQPDPARVDPDRVRKTMIDGVRAFIRAYGAR